MFCVIMRNVVECILCQVLVAQRAGPVYLVRLALVDGQVGRYFIVVYIMSVFLLVGSSKAVRTQFSLLIFRMFVTVDDSKLVRLYVR